jgi:hypothetical protein
MNSSLPISEIATELNEIYRLDPDHARPAVEAHLRRRLANRPLSEQTAVIENILSEFAPAGAGECPSSSTETELLHEVFFLFLGNQYAQSSLPPAELLKRLAESFNLVFNSLNRLIGVIHTTLMGHQHGPDATIRHVIRDHLEGEDRLKSLESYIGQIGQAFLLSHAAFTASAETIATRLIEELNPGAIRREERHSLRFGPLRKAESFDWLAQKHAQCRQWLESGRFKEDLLREFERACEGKIRIGSEQQKGGSR